MKICAISDTHGFLPEIEPCDLLLISGDIIPLHIQRNNITSSNWFYTEFIDWIGQLKCDKIIFIAGNHDFYLSNIVYFPIKDWTRGKCIYLQDELYKYLDKDGKEWNIYGTPWTHKFGNWAFMLEDEGLSTMYDKIPSNIDILLCHDTPKYKKLGVLPPSKWSPIDIDAGNEPLTKVIERVQPKYVFCGHLHTCRSKYEKIGESEVYNVSLLNNDYQRVYKPLYLEI